MRISSYGTFAGGGDAAAASSVDDNEHDDGNNTSNAHASAVSGNSDAARATPDSDPSRSLLARLLFLFVQPLAARSRTHTLQLDDVWPLAPENANARASHAFRAEYARSNALWVTIWHTERRAICTSALFAALSAACVSTVPLLLFELLQLVMARNARDAMIEVLLLLGGIHCGVVFGEVSARQYHLRMFSAQVRIVTSIRSLVFEKAISRVHRNQRHRGRSIATVATIYSTSLIYVSWMITRLHNTWVAAAKLAVLLLLLHSMLRVPVRVIATSLSAVCAAMLLLTFVVAKASERATKRRAQTLDHVHECFESVLAVKLQASERKMQHKIMRARGAEERVGLRAVLLRTLRFCVIWEAPALASVAIFSFLAARAALFSPATVFTALVLFDRIQTELYALVYAVRVGLDGAVALRRIQKYLWHCDGAVQSEVQRDDPEQRYPPHVVVALDRAVFSEASGAADPAADCVLANVSVRAHAGELVVVCGAAGSGKSTLLAALLGEVVRVRGDVYVSGACRVAYCPEEPWLQTQSVRANIVFGAPFRERTYLRVLDACCLVDDLNALPDGDATMVGPKGMNLSGGQKARIALARAVYSDADVFVLDCPLASTDAIVQSDVFRRCFLDLLRHRTIVLATHNAEIIASDFVDRVWHVDAKCVTEEVRDCVGAAETSGASSGERPSRRVRRLADSPPWRCAAVASAVSRTESFASSTSPSTAAVAPLAPTEEPFRSPSRRHRLQPSQLTICQSQQRQGAPSGEHKPISAATTAFLLDVVKDLLWRGESACRQAVALLWVALFVVYTALGVAKHLWLLHWSTLTSEQLQAAARVYNAFICAAFGVVLSATLVLSAALFERSRALFRSMTHALLCAPMRFFYRTPLGAILLRYSSDMQASDLFLAYHVAYALRSLLAIAASVGTVWYLLGTAGGALVALATATICREIVADRHIAQVFTVRDALDAANLNFVSEALDGSAVIRAFGAAHVQRFRAQHGAMLDNRSRIAYAVEVFSAWALIRYSLLVGVFLALIAVILALGALSPSALGLVLHCVFRIQYDLVAFSTGLLSATVHLTSVKHVLDLERLEPEEHATSEAILASVAWPTAGNVVFDNVWFQYDTDASPESRFALRDVSFAVAGGEKVGIVGRTGSGKSSLAMALFRIHDIARGRIFVDGVDISRLRLSDLRSRLCIIPQTPLFYRCSVRRYLDPFGDFDDAALWHALHKTGLTSASNSGHGPPLFVKSLEKQLDEHGANWSLGERQMLALTRALLTPSRILVLDEPFSSVDQASDARLLRVVDTEFARSTVFLVTHRLDHVLGFDQIVVMDNGRVAEVGSAQTLVANPNSTFYEFLETTLLTL